MLTEKGFCRICSQRVLGKVDRSQPSERVEWKGSSWTVTKPTYIWMFPSSPPGGLCYYHEKIAEKSIIESKNTLNRFQKVLMVYKVNLKKGKEED